MKQDVRSFQALGWALLFLTAAFLRFYQLGSYPPGLYRDEAFNGLDALAVLEGEHPLFFPANNGREPLYIYLTAGFVALAGRTVLAVRLAAAVIGTLTTWLTYKLAAAWLGPRVGFLSAWVWAITLWPVHLSRVGFRPILLVCGLALAFWLGSLAYQRRSHWLWGAAGMAYGLTFYTYLAARFTPLLLLLMGLYLWWQQRQSPSSPPKLAVRYLVLFGAGALLILFPLLLLIGQNPALVIGRTGQVSILNHSVNGGDVLGTLGRHTWQALGLFLWRGDTILRHNPAGRPLFDLFMAVPFVLGVGWCLHRWRQPAAMALLLWLLVMLGPTILAADAPHFLRAVGILPAAVIVPAIGLAHLWQWPRLPILVRRSLVVGLLLASLTMTVRDYAAYGRQPEVAYLFEQAAVELAQQIKTEAPDTAVFIDDRFWSGWQAIPFLVDASRVNRFQPERGLTLPADGKTAVFVWPHESLDFLPQALSPPVLVLAEMGGLARGDLETAAYPLYVRYTAQPLTETGAVLANFADQLQLHGANVALLSDSQLQIDLYWHTETAVVQPLSTFVHVIGPEGLVAQDDGPPAVGQWHWWQPGFMVQDRHLLYLPEPYQPARHHIIVGLYDVRTQVRLPVLDIDKNPVGDHWRLEE